MSRWIPCTWNPSGHGKPRRDPTLRKSEILNLSGREGNNVQTFKYHELDVGTRGFCEACCLGEGGFGKVYKAKLQSIDQVVAVKRLREDGGQGEREFLVEVLMLNRLHHNNLVKLIGYCSERRERLLIYEYMPLGSLEDHLHDLSPDAEPLGWNVRMKIAYGAAKGLEFLHDKADPPIIYRDLKSSNILLGEEFHTKLSDFGLARIGPTGDASHVSTRVMGTYGYCAPEYAMTGQLTVKSDIYSFGVLLLEILSGRRAIDTNKPSPEQSIVSWARPLLNDQKDRRKFSQIADPRLGGRYHMKGLYQALAVASMCVREQPNLRPTISDVVTALNFLVSQKYQPEKGLSRNPSPLFFDSPGPQPRRFA